MRCSHIVISCQPDELPVIEQHIQLLNCKYVLKDDPYKSKSDYNLGRYHSDEDFRTKCCQKVSERQKKRYNDDEEYREECKAAARDRYRRKKEVAQQQEQQIAQQQSSSVM